MAILSGCCEPVGAFARPQVGDSRNDASGYCRFEAREVCLWAYQSTRLFLLELMVNLARAEIDALDKQYTANEVESKIRDH